MCPSFANEMAADKPPIPAPTTTMFSMHVAPKYPFEAVVATSFFKYVQEPVGYGGGCEKTFFNLAVQADRLHDEIPGSRLKKVAGAGHFVMEDVPEEVARELAGFFSADKETSP